MIYGRPAGFRFLLCRLRPMRFGRWLAAAAAVFAVGQAARADGPQVVPKWTRSPWFEEQSFTAALEPNVRVHVNAPLDDRGGPAAGTRLIIFALPNGNTIEQTLGCKLTEGLDWHYDIQHVAAQVRLLRTLEPRERIVLVCVEAAGLSWPNWRATQPDANARIGRMVDEWRRRFGTEDAKITLTGHSGGGSFMFGEIEAADDIPACIDRTAFLDANYSFDAKLHATKFRDWLTGDPERRLIVVAYDDREIMFNGKKVVGPDGGTFRATGRMRDALGKSFPLTEAQRPPFIEYSGLNGRIHMFVHPNPENKILHTALVGDMNGLVHVAHARHAAANRNGARSAARGHTPSGSSRSQRGIRQSERSGRRVVAAAARRARGTRRPVCLVAVALPPVETA